MATYFGFGVSDAMFQSHLTIIRQSLSPEKAKELIEAGVIPCLNPSHKATIDAMAQRYGISEVEIPATAPKVDLRAGDSLIIMSPRGLPRLEGRHEYTGEEVAKATFEFSVWHVLPEAEFQGFMVTGFVHGGGCSQFGTKAGLPSETAAPSSSYDDTVRGVMVTFKE